MAVVVVVGAAGWRMFEKIHNKQFSQELSRTPTSVV